MHASHAVDREPRPQRGVNLARHWTSPSSATVRWLFGVLPWIVAVTVVLVVLDRGHRQAEVELLTGGPFATATIVSVEDAATQARYTNEVVGQVVADLDAGGADEGDAVDVAYDIDDPYHVERLRPPAAARSQAVDRRRGAARRRRVVGGGAVVGAPAAAARGGRVDRVQHARRDPSQSAVGGAAAVAVRPRFGRRRAARVHHPAGRHPCRRSWRRLLPGRGQGHPAPDRSGRGAMWRRRALAARAGVGRRSPSAAGAGDNRRHPGGAHCAPVPGVVGGVRRVRAAGDGDGDGGERARSPGHRAVGRRGPSRGGDDRGPQRTIGERRTSSTPTDRDSD